MVSLIIGYPKKRTKYYRLFLEYILLNTFKNLIFRKSVPYIEHFNQYLRMFSKNPEGKAERMTIRPRARNGTFCGVCGRPAAGNGSRTLCDVCSAGIMEGPGSAATQPGPGDRPNQRERLSADSISQIRRQPPVWEKKNDEQWR